MNIIYLSSLILRSILHFLFCNKNRWKMENKISNFYEKKKQRQGTLTNVHFLFQMSLMTVSVVPMVKWWDLMDVLSHTPLSLTLKTVRNSTSAVMESNLRRVAVPLERCTTRTHSRATTLKKYLDGEIFVTKNIYITLCFLYLDDKERKIIYIDQLKLNLRNFFLNC